MEPNRDSDPAMEHDSTGRLEGLTKDLEGDALRSPSRTRRIVYPGGAQRDDLETGYDQIDWEAEKRISAIFIEGEAKYGRGNYKKGLPFTDIYNHMRNHLNLYREGDRSEDHLAKAAWGAIVMMELERIHPESNNFGDTVSEQAEESE